MESKIYTKTTMMFLEVLKDLKSLLRYEETLKSDGYTDFVEVCNRETNFETANIAYAASLYRIRRIENNLKKIRDSEFIELFQNGFICLNQHRLLNLNTISNFKSYLESKLTHVTDLNIYTNDEETLEFVFDHKIIELINLTKVAISLEPNTKTVTDRHYLISRKKLMTTCTKSLIGISEVVNKSGKLDSMALDALRYYIELLLEEIGEEDENVIEIQWLLYQLEKSQAYDIKSLIERKWDLTPSDIAVLADKFMPNFIYVYAGVIKDLHLGHRADLKLEEARKQMIKEGLSR